MRTPPKWGGRSTGAPYACQISRIRSRHRGGPAGPPACWLTSRPRSSASCRHCCSPRGHRGRGHRERRPTGDESRDRRPDRRVGNREDRSRHQTMSEEHPSLTRCALMLRIAPAAAAAGPAASPACRPCKRYAIPAPYPLRTSARSNVPTVAIAGSLPTAVPGVRVSDGTHCRPSRACARAYVQHELPPGYSAIPNALLMSSRPSSISSFSSRRTAIRTYWP